jgi:hypothetical protein
LAVDYAWTHAKRLFHPRLGPIKSLSDWIGEVVDEHPGFVMMKTRAWAVHATSPGFAEDEHSYPGNAKNRHSL